MADKKFFEGISDIELHDELDRRSRERLIMETEKREKKNASILKHIDALLEIETIHHGKCMDENKSYAGNCTRCNLLIIKDEQMVNSDFDIVIECMMDPI